MTTRQRYSAEYMYPGALFPESTTRDLSDPAFSTAVAQGPDDSSGYFRKDGWYAVRISTYNETLFTAGDREVWVKDGAPRPVSYIVGERIHWQDITDLPENSVLISNIKRNSKTGYGVKTRCGNWQFESDYDQVIPG